MSGESPQDQTTSEASPEAAGWRRISLLIVALTGIGALSALGFGDGDFAKAIIVGGGIAWLGYIWLDRSLSRILQTASEGRPASIGALRFIGRYLVIGLLLWLIYRSEIVSMIGVLVGMTSFAFAVILEGIARALVEKFK
ncbi:MAG: ATP synthase subunit I [Acidobacteriota bacterium]